MIRRLLNVLLGPRCDRCPARVFPRDAVDHLEAHYSIDMKDQT